MKKIFAVDDDEDILYTIKKIFEDKCKQYKITTINSGKKLFKLLAEDLPDIIILDIMIPDMNGFDIYKKLKTRPDWKNIPILFISSIADDSSKKIAYKIGDDFIEKPFTPDVLLYKIENILEKID